MDDLDRLPLGLLLERFNASPEVAAVVDHLLGRAEAYFVIVDLAAKGLTGTAESGSELDRQSQAVALNTGQLVQWIRNHRASLRGLIEAPKRAGLN